MGNRYLWCLLLMAVSCAGYAYSGNDVVNDCPIALESEKASTPQNLLNGVHCGGYVAGLNDMAVWFMQVFKIQAYCIPATGLEIGQTIRVYLKWLNDHPEALHEPARSLFMNAMHDAFPCKAND